MKTLFAGIMKVLPAGDFPRLLGVAGLVLLSGCTVPQSAEGPVGRKVTVEHRDVVVLPAVRSETPVKTGPAVVFSLSLSCGKTVYPEEEDVMLNLDIANVSGAQQQIPVQYLQPKEKNQLFVGEEFTLRIEPQSNMERFTNHTPPEPKPHREVATLAPGETIRVLVPFAWYYYPVDLPRMFTVSVCRGDIVSNPVTFTVAPGAGIREEGNLVVNGNFSGGDAFPLGWRIQDPHVSWNKAGRELVFVLDRPTAEGEGLWTFSVFRPVTVPARLAIDVEAMSDGPDLITFVEGWGMVNGRRRRLERNECFMHPRGKEWQCFRTAVVFNDRRVQWFRVKLYAYLSPGTVRYRNVTLSVQPREDSP